jgi:hypothetical protein
MAVFRAPWLASGRGGISRSVLSRKGSCHPDKIVAGLRVARPADNVYKMGDLCRVSVCWSVRWDRADRGGWRAAGSLAEAHVWPEAPPSSPPSGQVSWALERRRQFIRECSWIRGSYRERPVSEAA